ncbi:MAG: 2-amino-4-hydroxy-6-hydroxymethyldihydropteridine diphosphokinase [Alphaproteobacteria bacterium]|jgi:2-amino-4-hydroxy-6-hydroxymethyldihydropteridine diphosphokinase
MTIGFIALGANLGDRLAALRGASSALDQTVGVSVECASGIYETAPVGGPDGQDSYLNAVIRVETTLSPLELLDLCQSIERVHNRVRDVRWGPRTLDLDVLFLGDVAFGDGRLDIPHPRLQDRRFVLAPLADVGADFVHPILKQTVSALLASLPNDDIDDVVKIMDQWRDAT